VLQYGPSAAGGGRYWSVASWYLVGSQVYHTSLIRVAVGRSLTGVIVLTGERGNSYNYATYFSNIPGTTLTVRGSAQLVWATETLESYGVTTSSDYPTGSTIFFDIYLRTTRGFPFVEWSPVSDLADKLTTTVNVQGAEDAKITIKYPFWF
jgi:hypothetical protein